MRTPRLRNSTALIGGIAIATTMVMMTSPAMATSPISFAAPATYQPGTFGGPFSDESLMVAGDFRHTGHPDLLVVNFYTSGVTLLKNNGDGTFQTPGTQIPIGSNPGIGTVVTGDFNHDGNLDFVALGNDGSMHVMLGDGHGAFSEKASYSIPQFGQLDAVVADFNGDGNLDVSVDTPTGVQMMLGHGDGTFTQGPTTNIPGATGTLGAVAVANCNNDGKPDLYVSNVDTDQVIALKGNGDGSFTVGGSGTTSIVPGSVYAGRFRETSGVDDAVAFNEFTSPSQSMSYLKSDGNCGFTSTTGYNAGFNIDSAAVADLGNGHLDIVSSDTSTSREVVLFGDGNGNFTSGPAMSIAPGTIAPQTPVVADFNGDGRPDIATVGVAGPVGGATSVSVILNNTP